MIDRQAGTAVMKKIHLPEELPGKTSLAFPEQKLCCLVDERTTNLLAADAIRHRRMSPVSGVTERSVGRSPTQEACHYAMACPSTPKYVWLKYCLLANRGQVALSGCRMAQKWRVGLLS